MPRVWQSYGEALRELGKLHDNVVVLDADLANATKTDIFKKAFPERHFDCGIAEADMMCVAAGLSTVGYVPFASRFGAPVIHDADSFKFQIGKAEVLREGTDVDSLRSGKESNEQPFEYGVLALPPPARRKPG